jgi:cytochrome c553
MVRQWLHSGVRSGVAVVAVLTACVASLSAGAQQAAPQGNPQRGKELSYTCLGCHGVDGYKNAYPTYSVPELEGQHPEYLSAALHEYRDGDRAHLTMHSQASSLSDQDIADIVSYFSGKPLTTTGKAAGSVPKAAQLCTTCHGQDGVGITGQYPTLAGQHPDYLARAIGEYKKGGRKNAIMTGMAAQIKDEDIPVIVEYFSKLKPSLSTESRPYTSFGREAAVEGSKEGAKPAQ